MRQILSDDFAYTKLTANFHLLSDSLKARMEEFMTLGRRDVRHPQLNSSEMKRSMKLKDEIVGILESKMKQLELIRK